MKTVFRIILFLLSGIVFSTYAQQFNLLKFTTKDGLPGSTINAVIKDSKNLMWIGTQEGGVSRFNGKTFTTFTIKEGLGSNDVLGLCEDDSGNIWVGTNGGGLAVFDGKKITRISDFGLDTAEISSIYKDKKSNIWISTFGNGLICYNGKKFHQYSVKNGLPTNDIFCSLQDNQGDYWIGTYHYGLCKINGSDIFSSKLNIKLYKDEIGGSHNAHSLMQDSKGTIWVGTTNAFVYQIKNGILSAVACDESLKSEYASSIIEGEHDAIWIATQGSGLLKYRNKTLVKYSEEQGFFTNIIYSLALDYEKNLWVGTGTQGICVFKNEAFINFNETDGLPNKQVMAIGQLQHNLMLIATASGLCYFDGKKITPIASIPELKNQIVHCIQKDLNENIWLGTDEGIIIIRKNEEFVFVKRMDVIEQLKINAVYGLACSDDGSIWVACSGAGLFKITDEKVEHFSAPNELLTDDLFTIHLGDDKSVWIGYLKAGASKFDGFTFSHYNNPANQLGNNTIECIAENKDGNMFFGTAENGMYCMKNNKFHNISTAQGLSSNVIYSIMLDYYNQNVLWVGTPKGLNRVVLDKDFNVKSIKYYTSQNGLVGDELSENCMLFDIRKNIWIGCSEGLSVFNPTLERINLAPPSLYLIDVRLYYQKVDWKKYNDKVDAKTGLPSELVLNYKNNHLTFDFQAISVDKEMKYSYILEGFDKDWSPPGKLNEAIYSNIPSGKDYIFRVKAQNSDGVWSTKNIEFKFTIESPIWQRWWFITLAILFALVGIVFYTNYRTAKLAKEKKLLEDTVASRTVELKETNDQLSDAFKDIKDSINYAQKIQQSILPVDAKVKAALPDSFILFKPRDIVSGDFYWFGSVNVQGVLHHILAAADCTGHGVPGAFMSMVGNTILNEIVITKHIIDPSEILSQLHHGVKTALQQSENESRDGMDICLCSINSKTNEVLYAGAFNPLWILRNSGEMEIIKATKSAIGGFTPDDQVFESHKVQLQKGECIYLFTDGYADQFGGENGKKLTSKKFRDALLANSYKTMKEQGFFLDNYIEIWKGNESQVDDILVIGARV